MTAIAPMPHSVEAEQSVLGALLLDNTALAKLPGLAPDHFSEPAYAAIFRTMRELISRGDPADEVTVGESGGFATETLTALKFSVPSAANIARYARIVMERAAERRLQQVGGAVMELSVRPNLDAATKLRQAAELVAGVAAQLPAQAGRLVYETGDTISTDEQEFDDELIEGVIGKAAMIVVYGDSNSSKTFLAIDMAAAVAETGTWMGRHCSTGLVVYLATEGPESVRMRVAALKRQRGLVLRHFVVVKSPLNLFDGTGDVSEVIALIRKLEREHGCQAQLVIGDTLARLAAGANENSGEDMTIVLRNADAIRSATGASFLWVHHSGKDSAKGARGWSGLRAAIDTEVEVTSDDATGIRCAEVTKQRDLPGKGDRYGYSLQSVHIGRNRWGALRSSAVVVPAEAPEREVARRRSEIAGAIVEALTQRGSGWKKREVVVHFEGRYDSGSVYREMKKLVKAGTLTEAAGVVALIEGRSR